jgi:hypothetical protein
LVDGRRLTPVLAFAVDFFAVGRVPVVTRLLAVVRRRAVAVVLLALALPDEETRVECLAR